MNKKEEIYELKKEMAKLQSSMIDQVYEEVYLALREIRLDTIRNPDHTVDNIEKLNKAKHALNGVGGYLL